MGNNYIETPSFYNNEEYFKKYLGQTSYYTNLQNIVKKIISLIEPNNVLELGAALGTTSIQLAKKYPDISFTGTDLREDVVEKPLDRDVALKNASDVVDGQIRLPKVVG